LEDGIEGKSMRAPELKKGGEVRFPSVGRRA
jgi:hypothetical protein